MTAIASLERAVELLPRDSESHWNLGTFLRKAGRGAEGAEQLRIAHESSKIAQTAAARVARNGFVIREPHGAVLDADALRTEE